MLPGVGPVATIAILLPVTFYLPPLAALTMLAGIYYGSQYGGSTTSILVNVPGESASVVTCIDGHQMARRGRAGAALAIAAIGSFVAGIFGTALIVVFGPALAKRRQRLRLGGVFRADGARPRRRGGDGARLAGRRVRDDPAGCCCWASSGATSTAAFRG